MNLPSCPKTIFGFLLRTGGKFLKSSAAYPKRFGQAIRNNHQRFLKKEICSGKRYCSESETGISVDQLVKGLYFIYNTSSMISFFQPNKCTSISKKCHLGNSAKWRLAGQHLPVASRRFCTEGLGISRCHGVMKFSFSHCLV